MRIICFYLLLFFTLPLLAQTNETDKAAVQSDSLLTPDPLYREDQFYASVSYNLIHGKADRYSQNSFSTGLTVGFLRDIPLNEARNRAVAIGLGYSYTNIKHNLKVSEITERDITSRTYEVVGDSDFSKNKLVLHYLELPIEFRWRNSTMYSHKFWRIYTGFKVSYLLNDRSQFESDEGTIRIQHNPDVNKWVSTAYVSAGWNTWNFYAAYSFTPIYKNAYTIQGEELKLSSFNIGLMFYIL